jgi:chromosome segregation ATPase
LEARQVRIAELMQRPHGDLGDQALKSELHDQRRRNEAHDRERQRQDKWLDVLNDQLARAREANDNLQRELADQQALKARIAALEAEIARLNNEIADRERRLAASRFECATARTTITHLQAQLERAAPAGAK